MRAVTIVAFLREPSTPPAKMCQSSLIYKHNFDSCVLISIKVSLGSCHDLRFFKIKQKKKKLSCPLSGASGVERS